MGSRRAVALLVLVAGLVIAVFASAASTGPRPAVARTVASPWLGAGFLAAPGGPFLTDAEGRRLQLHGVNLVAKCGGGAVDTRAGGSPCVGPIEGAQPAFVLTPDARDPGRRFTAADARTLASLGVDVVRLGIIWEGLEPGPRGAGINDPRYCAPHRAGTPFASLGAADPYQAGVLDAYLRRTGRIVGLLGAAGIRVILDMHQDVYGSAFSRRDSATPWNGEGAPPWATCTNGITPQPPATWKAGYGDPAVQAAIHNFMANDVSGDLQGQFDRVWQAVARHFRSDPDVAGYELYNEPEDFAAGTGVDAELQCDYGGPAREPASCASSHAQAPPGGMVGAIRAADPRHVVFFEPDVATDYAAPETIGITEPLRFRNVALSFHDYAAPASSVLTLVAGERARTVTEQPGGPPWVMDEFGSGGNYPLTGSLARQAGADDLSWVYWAAFGLHDPTGIPREGLINDRTRVPFRDKALALAVPYPAATAGTPGPQSFTAGVFRYRFRADRRISAPTEIVVPAYAYPRGYRATVTGGRIESAANARVLLIGALNAIVTVRVRRR